MKQLLLLLALISPSFAQLPAIDYAGMFFSTVQVSPGQAIRKVPTLPATCAAVGSASSSNAVLYQGRIYHCTSSNTWSALLTTASGVSSITGTANQVTASAATGAVTLSLPQSIATSSDVQFNRLGVGGAPSYALQIVDTVSSNGSQLYSFRGRSFNSSTTSAAHYHQGFSVATIARPAVSTTNSGYTWSVFADAYMDSGSPGTMTTLGGAIYRAYIDAAAPATAVVTTLTGLEGQVFNNKAGATVTTGIAVKADSTTTQTITNLYDFYAANASATNYFAGRLRAAGGISFTNLAYSQTAPTVTSAGTSPSITASNGTAAFIVNVGTGGVATDIVLAMPTANAGWICHATNITATAANRADQAVRQTASTVTSVTLQNQTVSTGAALAFTASDSVRVSCTAY